MSYINRFLTANGFKQVSDNCYVNESCRVTVIEAGYYEVNDGEGVMYSPNLEIYWLIGVLTYYDHMSKDYIKPEDS